jgi:8-oxo-dGTP diphosphatase
VAALIYQDGRLLACQRREAAPFPLKWEFPGGKVETEEGNLAALQRELKEELGITVHSATEVFRRRHVYPDQMDVHLTFFIVNDYSGTVKNLAFQQLMWVETQRLKQLDFLEGDLPLIEKLIRGELP